VLHFGLHGRLQLSNLHHHPAHAVIGATDLRDPRREPLDQLVVLVGDDPAHRRDERAVVDGVGEHVGRTGRCEIHEELELDAERLGALLLFGEHTVHAHHPEARDEDPIHESDATRGLSTGWLPK
jgi:hypothetical protein